MESFDNAVKKSLSFIDFDNDYVKSGISLFLVLYAGIAAPRLPEYVAKLFDYTVVKLIIFFLILYVARHDPTIAIIASIGVLISLMTLSSYKFNKEMMASIKFEETNGRIVAGNEVPQYTLGSSNGMYSADDSSMSRSYSSAESDKGSISGIEEGNHLPSIEDAHNVPASDMHAREYKMAPENSLPVPMDMNPMVTDEHMHKMRRSMVDDGHAKYESKHDLGYAGHSSDKDGTRRTCAGGDLLSGNEYIQHAANYNDSYVPKLSDADKKTLMEEEKVKIVLATADEYKRKMQRDLTGEELKQICTDVNKKYSKHHQMNDRDHLAEINCDVDKDFRSTGNPIGYDENRRDEYGVPH
jgi:hypothetical protein